MERGTNRIHLIVEAQLAAMGARQYEVGVKRATGRLIPLVLTGRQVIARVPWLWRENRGGGDVFIRPEGSIGLILVDDLSSDALTRLWDDGVEPAVVVETSPANHQVWVRVSAEPLDRDLASAVARELAERYDGDPNSAAWRHYGRLAGFENRKQRHRRPDGRYPLVRLLATRVGVATNGVVILDAARQHLAVRPMGHAAHALAVRPLPHPPAGSLSPLGQLYRREVARLLTRYPAADISRLDWMIVLSLARAFPTATVEELGQAMVEGSPRLDERKAGHVPDYVARTVTKALALAAAERIGTRAQDRSQAP